MRGALRVASLLIVAILSLGWVAPSAAQDEIVARGNQAYQDGDYVAAIEAYETVAASGFTSAGLQYNLGNAYFKSGDLARSILHWERALVLSPGDADTRANLELARSLTVDAVEPLPTFWVITAARWWVDALPRPILLTVVALSWLALTGGTIVRVLSRNGRYGATTRIMSTAAGICLLVFGVNLAIRETGFGQAERAVVIAEVVPVRSAPAASDDQTLFEVHQGTTVRIDQRSGEWAEVVLDDGKVGWLRLDRLEVI